MKRLILITLTFATAVINAVEDEQENRAHNPYFVIGNADSPQTYHFGYDSKVKGAPRLMREETRLSDGTVVGKYGYTDPFGVFRIVQYVAGLNGYYATEDIGGSSPSTPQYFKATARQVDEVSEEPRSYSQHFATKFNPPLYHPEAHMSEAPLPTSTPILSPEFRANDEVIKEENANFKPIDNIYGVRQEINFNYPKAKTETYEKPIVSNYNTNKKHHIFSLSDSEDILEGKHRKTSQYSTVLKPSSPAIQTQIFEKRFGELEIKNEDDFKNINRENVYKLSTDSLNTDFKREDEFNEYTTQSLSAFFYEEQNDVKNSTINENEIKSLNNSENTENSTSNFSSDSHSTKYSEPEYFTYNSDSFSTTETPIITSTEALPESVKHLYYSPTRTPATSYTSFSTSISRISSVSAEIHKNETNNENLDEKDIWDKIKESFVWNFSPQKTTNLKINENKIVDIFKPTETTVDKLPVTDVSTESLAPTFITQTPRYTTTSVIDYEQNSTQKSAEIFDIDFDYGTDLSFSEEKNTTPAQQNTTDRKESNSVVTEIIETTEQSTEPSTTTTTTIATTESLIDYVTESDIKIDWNDIFVKNNSEITENIKNTENGSVENIGEKELSNNNFFTTFTKSDEHSTEQKISIQDISTTEINRELSSTSSEVSNMTSTESFTSETQTSDPTTITTPIPPTLTTAYSSALPLIRIPEKNKQYIPPLSAIFGFPHLRKRVRKVQKIRLRQTLNNVNHEDFKDEITDDNTNPNEDDLLQSASSARVDSLESTQVNDNSKTTLSAFNQDLTLLKSAVSDQVYDYVPPFSLSRNTFDGKHLERSGDESTHSDSYEKNIDNSSDNLNSSSEIFGYKLQMNDNIKNYTQNNNNKQYLKSSSSDISEINKKEKLFEISPQKYLFPLDPHSDTSSEIQSSKFIPVEPYISKVSY